MNHEKSFREAVKSINEAVTRALPSPKIYECVQVITLRWDNDDLGLADIEAELLKLFQQKFHYTTESVLIPSSSVRDATLAIREKLQSLISKYDGPSTLFVIVYEGHLSAEYKAPTSPPTPPLYIMGSAAGHSVSIPWTWVESDLVAVADADVLIILDSCYSAGAAMGTSTFEYLAASAFESLAADRLEVSLSRRLIDLLKNMDTEEMTVAQVHANLVKKANHPGSNLEYTPVHIAAPSKPSITLRPIQTLRRELAGLRQTGALSNGKVLVSVLVEGKTTVPNIEAWKKWLSTSIPDDVANIKVEAVFESNSSLCLLTMPTAVWDMIKGNKSYNFVSFVESNNLLLYRTPSAGDVAILRSHPGNIDVSHGGKE